MKIFGREPAVWSAFLIAIVSGLAAFGVPGVDAGASFAIGGLISAAFTAWTTRPATPGVLTGLVTSVAAVLAEYRLDWSEGQVAALSGVVLTAYTLIYTNRTTPVADPRPIR